MKDAFKLFEPMYYFKLGDKYYQVTARDFFKLDKTFSSVSAGSTSSKTEVDELEPEKGEVYVFTMGVFQKGISVEVYQPAAVGRFGVKNYTSSITWEDSPAEEPNQAIVLATVHGHSLSVKFTNNLDVAVTPKLRFIGFKYKVEEVKDAAKIRELETLWKEGKLPEVEIKYE